MNHLELYEEYHQKTSISILVDIFTELMDHNIVVTVSEMDKYFLEFPKEKNSPTLK